jgi:cytochrome c oxidase subunit 4
MSDEHASHPHVKYWMVFAFLCAFTALSVLADEAKKHGMIRSYLIVIVIVLSIASAKALFVMMYFMHLKFEGRWKYLLLSPTVILAIGLPMALLPDIGAHYYTVDVPQDSGTTSVPAHAEAPAAQNAH